MLNIKPTGQSGFVEALIEIYVGSFYGTQLRLLAISQHKSCQNICRHFLIQNTKDGLEDQPNCWRKGCFEHFGSPEQIQPEFNSI